MKRTLLHKDDEESEHLNPIRKWSSFDFKSVVGFRYRKLKWDRRQLLLVKCQQLLFLSSHLTEDLLLYLLALCLQDLSALGWRL